MNWTPHKILTPPSDEEMLEMEPDELVTLHTLYHEAIANEQYDPYTYGHIMPNWEKAWGLHATYRTLLLLGANRSSKSSFGARTVVQAAQENPKSLIYCFSQNQETSVIVQQAAIWHYLPPELKVKTTGEVQYISFSAQNGFAGNSIIFPNGSRIQFKTYSQFQQNNSILEGMELGCMDPKWLNIGAWCDEYLSGMDLLDRLYLRLATRNSKMLITFTPKDGITETVSNYIKDAKTIESREAELLNNRMVPYVQTNERKNTAIVYFHTKDNPWGGYESIAEICKAKDDQNYTLTAAYGVPTKSYTSVFPCFSNDVNVVTEDKIPTEDVTRYCIIDPAGRKNWFITWIAVDQDDTWWVYREWPDISEGEWATQGKSGKWVPGDGCKGQGKGIKDYIDLIENCETLHGVREEIYEYLIDPRLGAQRNLTADGDSCIIEDLEEHGFVAVPAPGGQIEDGIQKLVSQMAYDQKKPIDSMNHPRFYISERCENTIRAMAEYTGNDGKDEAWKDPIDTMRYAAAADIAHFEPVKGAAKPWGGY